MSKGSWTTGELLNEAARLGLKLEAKGDRLSVVPARSCTPDFADVLRRHKRTLLDWFENQRANLSPDCLPWLHIARQVLAGEFDGSDSSTIESLVIGLRNIPHQSCRRALERLRRRDNGQTPNQQHDGRNPGCF